MKKHTATKAALLALLASGLWACSSDPKTTDTGDTQPGTPSSTTSSGYGSSTDVGGSTTSTDTADAGMSGDDSTGSSSVNRTPDMGASATGRNVDSTVPEGGTGDVAAMETTDTGTDTATQSEDYERSQRK